MSRSSELQREREVQRLYHGWQSAQGSSLNVALSVDSLAQADLHGTGYKPQSTQDGALLAFAQLAVLKLGVRRAMVSLIDRDTQMILAEATDTVGMGSATDQDLWLGSTVLTRSDAVCEHAMRNMYTARDPNNNNITYTAPALVVPDCRFDTRFYKRPYVLSEPGVRFYAGVPIVSPLGHRIGVYAVSDEKPHEGLTIEELKFMEGVARTIMDHLETARDRVDRFKGERIVRGLAAFIEGSSVAVAPDQSPNHSPEPRPSQVSLVSRRRPLSRNVSYNRSESDSQPWSEDPGSSPATSIFSSSAPSTSPSRSRPKDRKGPKTQPKGDALGQMYTQAAELLRQSTLADGVALFGASPSNSKQQLRRALGGSLHSSDEEDVSASMTSGSEGVGLDSSDSDSSPAARPCKILACALADDKARADIEQGSALTLGALERYFDLFPKGKAFSFTSEGAGISSEDDSASDREPSMASRQATGTPNVNRRRRASRMDHKELLKKIPGARSVVFVPLYSSLEDRFAGGCFLWTSVTGRMMNMDDDLSYLRAFTNSIMSEVARINAQKDEAAKTTFIASISHELRSPLHGILGAAEFLMDTTVDSYQSGLVTSVATCGKTLLDTLNHLLDYSKINRLARTGIKRNARRNRTGDVPPDPALESMNMTAVIDLAILVEEVVDAVSAGNTFDKLPGAILSKVSKSTISASVNTMSLSKQTAAAQAEEGPVSVLLDICPRASWMVRTQPGALRRIIMNLLGNALKYTLAGYVQVSLRAQEMAANSKTAVVIKVVDTGKGMSEEFQRERLFVPFSQEDSFQPGTGLGLSIVKQIVDSLGGSIEVKSEQGKGTEVVVRLTLVTVTDDSPMQPDEEMHDIAERTRGKRLVMLDGVLPTQPPMVNQQIQKLDLSLKATCSDWFGMNALREHEASGEPDVLLYCEPPSVEVLQQRFMRSDIKRGKREAPVVIVCLNAKDAIKISQNQSRILTDLGRIVEVIPQPCGPRKLAKVFSHCLSRREEALAEPVGETEEELPNLSAAQQKLQENHPPPPAPMIQVEEAKAVAAESGGMLTAEVHSPMSELAQPSPPPLDPATPSLDEHLQQPLPKATGNTKADAPSPKHVLLVDDNHINLQLLVMLMKKCGFTYEQAENGQQALDKYTETHSGSDTAGRKFDYVLMDINMPVMNGLEATRRIRDLEREKKLAPTNVIALTGLASVDAQRDAKAAGVDVFLPKPVRFAELKKLLAIES